MAKSFDHLSIPDLDLIKESLECLANKCLSHINDLEKNHLETDGIFLLSRKLNRAMELKAAIETEIICLKEG